ncbi:MAG: pyruvate:ferredoxin (flavodoxin) oxidoreductase, partial [Oscillospiraceae bacterium]|nr:pyruvate:ferredoxin (flavodoxin) oxidoreductase [Oscillospiraceae bacterium]
GAKVGLLKVRLYRPFKADTMLAAIPGTVRKAAVLDRTKEPGSNGEPLFQDVCTAYYGRPGAPLVVAGRYGLGSKDTTPAQIAAVYESLASPEPKARFTIGIKDDVTNLSLAADETIDTTPKGTRSCKFWGLGSDGTVGANKNSVKIIGDHTDMNVQAYFSYDSKKSGGITISHLRFGTEMIKSSYLISKADFVACHNQSYVDKYEIVTDLKKGGVFLLNTQWGEAELDGRLPAAMKRYIAANGIRFFTIDGIAVGRDLGLGGRINMVMQAAFFKLADIIPLDDAVGYMKAAIIKSYGKKGDAVINMNYGAVDRGISDLREITVPESWRDAVDADPKCLCGMPDFVKDVVIPVNAQMGDKLPVSAFAGREDGTFPQGTSMYEKRGIAVDVPEWDPERCIQCNQCSYVCPHATIRPFILSAEEAAAAPAGYKVAKANGKGYEDASFRMQVSPLDCTGCANCEQVCPAKVKALTMRPAETQALEGANWDYSLGLSAKANRLSPNTVKGSQFETPLLEFSGACAGCGETPYAKLLTQLYGPRMMIANATGCSSIWAGSAPAMPYTVGRDGRGPTWANSLFEDNAEYGYGMYLGVKQRRLRLAETLSAFAKADLPSEWGLKEASEEWLAAFGDGKASEAASAKVKAAVAKAKADCGDCGCEFDALYEAVAKDADMLVKKSVWVIGGDGWAYDIGYGGLDHVLACGEDVNVLVFDTEIYSNTGGQSSKSTPTGAIAQFAASGKATRKKDLGMMAISYGYVYVAQVAMGASQAQLIKAVSEAEAYKGPSLILAYAPCISHGISKGMSMTQHEQKAAVEAGYWHLYRYNPDLKAEGKNPFILDSKEPTGSYRDFIMGEVRYSSLHRSDPGRADSLFAAAERESRERYESYRRLAD